jgi:dTDP-4-amino-4,6-dideoxygalactose transaminase
MASFSDLWNIRPEGYLSCRRWCITTGPSICNRAYSLGVRRGQFPVTEHLCTRTLALPANESVSRNDIEFTSKEIQNLLGTKP